MLTCIHTLNVCQILPVFFSLLLLLSFLLSVSPSPPPSSPPSLPLTDSSDSDLELSTVRHQPEGLDQLQAQTKFTRKELQSLYRGFKNVRLSWPLSVPAEKTYYPNTLILSLSPWSRSVPVEWWMRRHSRPSILSSFPKEVRDIHLLVALIGGLLFRLNRECVSVCDTCDSGLLLANTCKYVNRCHHVRPFSVQCV